MINMGRVRRGDIYPGSGDSTIVRSTPSGMEQFYPDDVMHEGGPSLPVTPSTGDGLRVGQFSLAQATVGLLVLLGVIWWMDERVMK